MKVEWQEINGEKYFNDPGHGWLRLLSQKNGFVPEGAVFRSTWREYDGWSLSMQVGDALGVTARHSEYAVPCDPPCTLAPQDSLDVCLEYVSYKVSKATKGMQPEVKEAFLQKVYALKQTFALEVEKLLSEVKHG